MQPHWHWTRGFLIQEAGIHASQSWLWQAVSFYHLGKRVQDSKSKKLMKST